MEIGEEIIINIATLYPHEFSELLPIFLSLDQGNGVILTNMKDKKVRESLRSLFKQIGYDKVKTIDGEKAYQKGKSQISLEYLYQKVLKKIQEKKE